MTLAVFRHQVEVPWADTDAAGVVWFGNFARYVEAAEVAMLAASGQPVSALFDAHHIFTPRTHYACSFRSPARFADRLDVTLTVTSITDRRVALAFRIDHAQTGRAIAEGHYRIACVDARTFEPRAFPEDVAKLLAS